jgi:hypothetical protein
MSTSPTSPLFNDPSQTLEELFEKTARLEAENNSLRANVATFNEMTAQRLFLQRALTGNAFGEINTSPSNRDYYGQFGYPQAITKQHYQQLYDRNALASRVVRLFPMECWQTSPLVCDKDSPSESSFEGEFKDLCQAHSFWEVLERADILSGIGAYGIILFGLDDNASLDQPVTGYMEGDCKHNLLYLRAFPHSMVEISSFCTDRSSPRYGNPEMYRIQQRPMADFEIEATGEFSTINIHWTRILHLADNRETSEIFGVPRLQLVYNILLDVEKVLGCSGEMFYKGTYPGYAIETANTGLPVQLNQEEVARKMAEFQNGYQRWIGLQNAHITALPSMYSESSGLIDQYITMIAIAKAVPDRILKGSERGELASGQDAVLWSARVQGRRTGYCIPRIIRPFCNRIIKYGCCSSPYNNDYSIEWVGSDTQDPNAAAEHATKIITLLQTYASNDLSKYISPRDFLIKYMYCTDTEADTLLLNAQKYTQEQAILTAIAASPAS